MADLKISQLPVATTPLAGTELVPIVQGGTTDQTTVEGILTGTVPSGTTNGVLFLNGSKVVTSAANFTFNGTTLSAPRFQIQSGGFITDGASNVVFNPAAGGSLTIASNGAFTNGNIIYNALAASGIHAFQINNAEQMRLNSTGLGLGTNNPLSKLHVSDTVSALGRFNTTNANGGFIVMMNSGTEVGYFGTAASLLGGGSSDAAIRSNAAIAFGSGGGVTRMLLDASGNLGINAAPQAWNTNHKAIEIAGASSAHIVAPVNGLTVGTNYYINAGSSFIYAASGQNASRYAQTIGGQHQWFNAPSGTAGNTISFTQAMTLDASGNLGIGSTPSGNYLLQANTNSAPGRGFNLMTLNGGYSGADYPRVGFNFRTTVTNGSYLYNTADYSSSIAFASGGFQFLQAGIGTAGNAISFTQAMTLDASGRLSVGLTAASKTLNVSGSAAFFEGTQPRALIGSPTWDLSYAAFQNGTLAESAANAAIAQSSQGDTQVGAASGRSLTLRIGNVTALTVTSARSVVVNTAALATTATDGFLYVPTCAGQPTGVPTAQTGTAPIVVDTTNNKLYFYSGGAWRDAGP